MSVTLAGALPGDADCVGHHGPILPLFEEPADLVFDLSVKLALAFYRSPELIRSRRSPGPRQQRERWSRDRRGSGRLQEGCLATSGGHYPRALRCLDRKLCAFGSSRGLARLLRPMDSSS